MSRHQTAVVFRMLFRLLADLVVIFHVAFVLFVVLGSLLVIRWRRLAWIHLPAAIWGVWIEYSGWICPLTPLENALRVRGGEAGYNGGFVEHYVIPLLYPAALSRNLQWILGTFVIAVNVAGYGIVLGRRRIRLRAGN
jgi:hypothetical protein